MLGVCYYPEHWPESMWAQDAKEMRELDYAMFALANLHGQELKQMKELIHLNG